MPCNASRITRFMSLLFTIILLSACSIPAAGPTPTTAPATTAVPTLAQPTPTQPAPTAVPSPSLPAVANAVLRSFEMVDYQNGWAASETMVLRSSDGGVTWRNATPKDAPAILGAAFQVKAVSPLAAWVLIPDAADYKKGTLFRTADGGQTWQANEVPFGGGWIQFQDDKKYAVLMADRGVAAGSQAVDLYQTSDGGATWMLVYHVDPENPADQGITFGGDKSGVAFLDSTRGWITGFIPMDGATYLYATQDGGKTWKQVQLGLPAGWQQAQIDTKPPVFFGSKEGILTLQASTNVGQMVFYVTHDGGDTWQPTTPLKASGMVSIPTANDIIVWNGGTLQYSPDAGQTWQERTPNVDLSQSLIAVQFADSKTGWALSQDANSTRLYCTTDGGLTWQ